MCYVYFILFYEFNVIYIFVRIGGFGVFVFLMKFLSLIKFVSFLVGLWENCKFEGCNIVGY